MSSLFQLVIKYFKATFHFDLKFNSLFTFLYFKCLFFQFFFSIWSKRHQVTAISNQKLQDGNSTILRHLLFRMFSMLVAVPTARRQKKENYLTSYQINLKLSKVSALLDFLQQKKCGNRWQIFPLASVPVHKFQNENSTISQCLSFETFSIFVDVSTTCPRREVI